MHSWTSCSLSIFCIASVHVGRPKPLLALLHIARWPASFGVLVIAKTIRISALLLHDGRDLEVFLLAGACRFRRCEGS
ncbi:hypothetical protein DAI22_06g169003 [Oryza sativa Japonica Group]|nr:hypothetical protein DAI22_06g169003 [Oryza sativa Japonica Group]